MNIHVPKKLNLILDGLFGITTQAENEKGGTLSGLEIYNQVQKGGIVIDPFNEDQINSNSYNVRLGNELKVYKEFPLRFDKTNPTEVIEIPEDGYTLMPGILYLGTTIERVYTGKFKPTINGRSSGGRLGIDIHKCAGFGDVGFDGQWTLEIEVIHPVVIKPGLEIAQISFDTISGDVSYQYKGRYNKQVGVTASKIEENKKGKFSDFYRDYKLINTFTQMFTVKETTMDVVSARLDYLEYDNDYDISANLYEGETITDLYCIIKDKDGNDIGRMLSYNGTDVYVRKLPK